MHGTYVSLKPQGHCITPRGIDSGTYDAQDRMLSYAGSKYFYAANGDLQAKIFGTDTTKYAYDAMGNLTQVVMPNGDVIQYVIDGQNRRIARKLNGRITNKWLYAGQLTPVAELDSADNIIARFSGGYMNQNDTIYQIITDHLGSPRLVVNVATGAVVLRMDYGEFGNVTYDSNPGFQPFGFAGGLYDPDTKLVRFGFRDYDATTGRWTIKDPAIFAGGLSNLFEYVAGDPINYFDLWGLQRLTYDEVKKMVQKDNQSGQSDELIMAVIWKESGFDPTAANRNSSAIGLMQVTKAAAKDAGYDYKDVSTDQETNVLAGSKYVGLRIKWAKNDVTKGLNGYGTGEGYATDLLEAEKCLKNAKNPCDAMECLKEIHP